MEEASSGLVRQACFQECTSGPRGTDEILCRRGSPSGYRPAEILLCYRDTYVSGVRSLGGYTYNFRQCSGQAYPGLFRMCGQADGYKDMRHGRERAAVRGEGGDRDQRGECDGRLLEEPESHCRNRCRRMAPYRGHGVYAGQGFPVCGRPVQVAAHQCRRREIQP